MPLIKLLATVWHRMGVVVQNLKTEWNYHIKRAQDLLQDASQNKYKNRFSFPVSHLFSQKHIVWYHFICYEESKSLGWEQTITYANSRLLSPTKWDQKSSTLNSFVQSLGNRMTLIGYFISETKDEMKLAD